MGVLSHCHPEWAHIEQVELTKIHAIPDPHQALTKSAVIFGAGQLDRSPCGTGASASRVLALAHAKGGSWPSGWNTSARGSSARVFAATWSGRLDVLLDPRVPLARGFLLDAP